MPTARPDLPRTELDAQFSEPGATATPWADVLDVLQQAGTFWVTTVRADGRPHVTPLVAVWLDGALSFCTGEGEQKPVNLRANPNVVLTTGRSDWNEGIDVVVEGVAKRVTDESKLTRLSAAWTTKWDGRWHFEVCDGGFRDAGETSLVLVFEVVPTKVLSFAKAPFAASRHTF